MLPAQLLSLPVLGAQLQFLFQIPPRHHRLLIFFLSGREEFMVQLKSHLIHAFVVGGGYM